MIYGIAPLTEILCNHNNDDKKDVTETGEMLIL